MYLPNFDDKYFKNQVVSSSLNSVVGIVQVTLHPSFDLYNEMILIPLAPIVIVLLAGA